MLRPLILYNIFYLFSLVCSLSAAVAPCLGFFEALYNFKLWLSSCVSFLHRILLRARFVCYGSEPLLANNFYSFQVSRIYFVYYALTELQAHQRTFCLNKYFAFINFLFSLFCDVYLFSFLLWMMEILGWAFVFIFHKCVENSQQQQSSRKFQ